MKHPTQTETAAQPPSSCIDTATIELLARWAREDATDDPELIRAAEREIAEFKKAMNANRAASGEPLLYP